MLVCDNMSELLTYVRGIIKTALSEEGVAILPPQDVTNSMRLVRILNYHFDVTMLDPWYNKGVGGLQ